MKYIIHLNDRPLLNAAILEDDNLCISKSWRKRVEKIVAFFQCDINKLPDTRCIYELLKNMKNSYIDNWRKLLGDESSQEGKLYLYRRFKSYFGMEPYLRHIQKLKFRRAMTAFRLSAHNLEIETGQYVYDRSIELCQGRNVLLNVRTGFVLSAMMSLSIKLWGMKCTLF